jgi:hypothetical protein
MDETQRIELCQTVASTLRRWGMTTPAILFLESNRPFSFFAGQFLLVAEPLLGLFVRTARSREVARLLDDPASVELLLQHLEASD